MGGILGVDPTLWALQKLGGALPKPVQEYGSSLVDEALARIQGTGLYRAGGALVGATPEQLAEQQGRLKERITANQQFRGKSNIGRAADVLLGGTGATKAEAEKPYTPTPAVTPPSPTPEPAVTGAAAPKTKNVLRQIADPYTGKPVWITQAATTENDEAGYQAAAAKMRDASAREQAGRDMSTSSLQSGERNPRGFASREGTPGTYSYTGSQAFLDKGANPEAYKPEEFSQLHELEQQRVLEQAARNQQLTQSGLASREATAQVRQRELALKQAEDPMGFQLAQSAQFRQAAEQQLADPGSPLSIRFRLAMNKYRLENPTATKEQMDEYAILYQDQLLNAASLSKAQELRMGSYGQQQGRPTDPMFAQSYGFGMPGSQ